jgi:hypothetical protein
MLFIFITMHRARIPIMGTRISVVRLAAMIIVRWKIVIRARDLMMEVAVILVALSVKIVVVHGHGVRISVGGTMRGTNWVEVLIIIGILVVPVVEILMLTARILFIPTRQHKHTQPYYVTIMLTCRRRYLTTAHRSCGKMNRDGGPEINGIGC